jgi:DNA invertase Pin-like site-specific DNA recombinase
LTDVLGSDGAVAFSTESVVRAPDEIEPRADVSRARPVAQLARELVSERAREALAEKRTKGWQPGKLGRDDRAAIVRLYVKEGRSIADIARKLSDDLGRTVHRTSVANGNSRRAARRARTAPAGPRKFPRARRDPARSLR